MIRRKGHDVLCARLPIWFDLDWHLTIVGLPIATGRQRMG